MELTTQVAVAILIVALITLVVVFSIKARRWDATNPRYRRRHNT